MAKTANVLERYECGPFRFADDDYYDRHLVFDHVVLQDKANTAPAIRSDGQRDPRSARAALAFDRADP